MHPRLNCSNPSQPLGSHLPCSFHSLQFFQTGSCASNTAHTLCPSLCFIHSLSFAGLKRALVHSPCPAVPHFQPLLMGQKAIHGWVPSPRTSLSLRSRVQLSEGHRKEFNAAKVVVIVSQVSQCIISPPGAMKDSKGASPGVGFPKLDGQGWEEARL